VHNTVALKIESVSTSLIGQVGFPFIPLLGFNYFISAQTAHKRSQSGNFVV
jgi:hypothetical protein